MPSAMDGFQPRTPSSCQQLSLRLVRASYSSLGESDHLQELCRAFRGEAYGALCAAGRPIGNHYAVFYLGDVAQRSHGSAVGRGFYGARSGEGREGR